METGPFRITPYLADHSAYDAYSILVEADGRKLFYSGDFRGHGRKGRLLDRLVVDPPRAVDVLMLEGTTLGREDSSGPQTETDLEQEFERLFAAASGMSYRVVLGAEYRPYCNDLQGCQTCQKAVDRRLCTRRAVLKATGNPKIPQPGALGFPCVSCLGTRNEQ